MKTLYDCFSEVQDCRRSQGQRFTMESFLEMTALAGMSGFFGINSIARFIKNNEKFFISRYNLQHGVPSKTTIFNIFKSLSFDEYAKCFKTWMDQFINIEHDLWISIDGKAINSTVIDNQGKRQNYKSMVSLFCSKMGVVLDSSGIENKKSNEGLAARELIEKFNHKQVTFTLDALHLQKKHYTRSWSQEMTT